MSTYTHSQLKAQSRRYMDSLNNIPKGKRAEYNTLQALRILREEGSVVAPIEDSGLEAKLEDESKKDLARKTVAEKEVRRTKRNPDYVPPTTWERIKATFGSYVLPEEEIRFTDKLNEISYAISPKGRQRLSQETAGLKEVLSSLRSLSRKQLNKKGKMESVIRKHGYTPQDFFMRKLLLIDGAFDDENYGIFTRRKNIGSYLKGLAREGNLQISSPIGRRMDDDSGGLDLLTAFMVWEMFSSSDVSSAAGTFGFSDDNGGFAGFGGGESGGGGTGGDYGDSSSYDSGSSDSGSSDFGSSGGDSGGSGGGDS